MALGEFDLIRRHFSRPAPGVRLGIGDDAALLDLPPGETLAVTSDTLVAGRHFPLDTPPFDIGWKALAVNLSDLAAMGARPLGVTLALTLPDADDTWLTDFSAGFFALAEAHDVPLIGGDTTRGPLSITVTALGSVPPVQALRRDGAQAGDLVCVTGSLGDAGLGLALALGHDHGWLAALPPAHAAQALARLHRPAPRLAAGLALRGLASAAMDISDGLLQDLGHLCRASGGLGAILALDRLPRSPALSWLAGESPQGARQAIEWALAAGDDYELLFTLPPAQHPVLQTLAARLSLPLTCIGTLTATAGMQLRHHDQPWAHPLPAGYQHFHGDTHGRA